MLSVRGVTLTRSTHLLLQKITFDVPAGSIVILMGPSGTGKSTLLNWMIGELDPTFKGQGELWLNGVRRDLSPTEQRRIGILFQDDLLFPHLSVGQNLALALPATMTGKVQRRQHIERQLDEAELTGFYTRDPATLSGGQRARVSLLRALLAEPEALLLDEPFSRLDIHLRARFRQFVFDHIAHRGIPAVLVTHDAQDIPPDGRIIMLGEDHHA
ncbi:ATP-binding cassette domain-containing protein [Serratia sp. UGAL515B_01]|uniref:ATP-binding cassette domain-containing protein n=1 Tax=Serratia sp. UGAL515B_01 TaxID=2986763 RepID=UPI002954512A|nr:ATP-binding cassette domain-containing protein [Serratia sp. UGAL515B_01]WON77724.1 ATP-binding cassette domain-containing protein [Serratia sp. UGAL515B_01]